MDAVTPTKWRKPSTKPETAPARFHAKWIGEPNSGCWLWTGSLSANGYGNIHDGTRLVGVHRYSYILHHGPVPKGMYVCHRCDEPTCVNPDHLFADTPHANQIDMVRKGRERGGRPEWEHPKEFREKIQQDPRPYRVIAEEYGLTFGAVKALKSSAGRGIRVPRIGILEAKVARMRSLLERCIGSDPQLDAEIQAELSE